MMAGERGGNLTYDELLARHHTDTADCSGCAAYGKRPFPCGCGSGLVHCVWLFRHEALVHPIHGTIAVGDYMCWDGGILCKGLPAGLRNARVGEEPVGAGTKRVGAGAKPAKNKRKAQP